MEEYLNQIPDFLIALWFVLVIIAIFRMRKVTAILEELRTDILARAMLYGEDELNGILERLNSLNNLKIRIKALFFFWNPVTYYLNKDWILNGDSE